jgi:hypothetical protein
MSGPSPISTEAFSTSDHPLNLKVCGHTRGNPIGIRQGYFRGDAIYEWNIPLGSRSARIAWSR